MNQILETNAAISASRECPAPVSIADVLRDVFGPGLCDFCGEEGRQYPDPGTGFRFCLECLELECECNTHGMSLADPLDA